MRFLEAQNKTQATELGTLRDRWGKETEEVKNMYNVELENLQKLLNDSNKLRGKSEIELNNLENELKKALDA